MDKIFKLLFSAALLLCCITLNAQQPKGDGSQDKTPLSIDNVAYIDADGVEQTVTATVITDETSTLNAGWYAVTGSDVQTRTLTCNGAVNLILADGAKLTVAGGDSQAGINVSGNGNSLTIYGQSAQSGQLIANGGFYAADISGGYEGSGSNIKVAASLTVYADNTNPPILEIPHTDDDIASHTAFRYVVVKDVVTGIKDSAIAAIAALKSAYNSGLGEMGEPCEDCPVVEVTKGTKTVKLYNPENVKFKKE
ncbi:MAG: hypothetical protein MJZ56_05120 [Bacteroidales bacterium]|nr:hypothetical protein [Bacteroidales bacterium]